MTRDEVQQLIDDTFSQRPQSWGYRSVPTEADKRFDTVLSDFIAAYCAMPPENRAMLYEKLTARQQSALKGFALKMAVYAVRENEGSKVAQCAQAFAIAGFRQDWRDDYIALSTILHTMHKLALNAHQLFEDAAQVADEDATYHLRHFVGYSPSIETMRIREGTDKNGLFAYVSSER